MLNATAWFSACGFQLRTEKLMPERMKTLQLEFEKENGAWKSLITRFFERQGINWQKDARTILFIRSVDIEKLPVSFSPQGKAVDVALTQTLRFVIKEKDGETLTSEQAVSVQRVYQFDPKRITGKVQEEQLIIKEQQTELVYRLYDRLIFISADIKPLIDHKDTLP